MAKTSTACFVRSVEELRWLREQGWLAPGAPRELLVTDHHVVALELRRAGVSFVDLWSLFEVDDLQRVWERAFDLCERWCDELGLRGLSWRGGSLQRAAEVEFLYAFECALGFASQLRRLFERHGVRRLRAQLEPPRAFRRNGPGNAQQPARAVQAAVLRWMADRGECALEPWLAPVPVAYPTRASSRALDARARAVRSPSPPSLARGDGSAGAVLVLGLGQNEADFAALEQVVACMEPRGGWSMLRFVETLRPGFPHGFSPSEEDQRWLDEALAAYRAAARAYCGPEAELFGNEHLAFQFESVLREVLEAVPLVQATRALVCAQRPRLALLGADCFVLERLVVHELRALGVPTVALLHGVTYARGYRELRPACDYAQLWSRWDEGWMRRYGVAPERLLVSGSLRENERYLRVRAEGLTPRAGDPAMRALLGAPPRRPVVLLLSSAGNVYNTAISTHPLRHRETFEQLVALARSRPEWTFALKPHPSFDWFDWYRDLAAHGPPNLVLWEQVPLPLACEAADLAVMVNVFTSAVVEALLLRTPTVLLAAVSLPYEAVTHPLSGASGEALRLADTGALDALLARWAREPALGQQLLDAGRRFLEDAVGCGATDLYARVAAQWTGLVAASSSGPAEPSPLPVLPPLPTIALRVLAAPTAPRSLEPAASALAAWLLAALADAGSDAAARERRAGALFACACALGGGALAPRAWLALLRDLAGRVRRPLGAAVAQRLYVAAVLSALTQAVERREWSRALALGLGALRHEARPLLASPLFVRLLGRAATERAPLLLRAVDGYAALRARGLRRG